MKLKTPRHFIKDREDELAYVEERFILDVTHAVAVAVDKKGSRKDVAEAIGMRPQQLSDLLSGEANMTLRTLARVAYAVDLYPQVGLAALAVLDRAGGSTIEASTLKVDAMEWTPTRLVVGSRPFAYSTLPVFTLTVERPDGEGSTEILAGVGTAA